MKEPLHPVRDLHEDLFVVFRKLVKHLPDAAYISGQWFLNIQVYEITKTFVGHFKFKVLLMFSF